MGFEADSTNTNTGLNEHSFSIKGGLSACKSFYYASFMSRRERMHLADMLGFEVPGRVDGLPQQQKRHYYPPARSTWMLG